MYDALELTADTGLTMLVYTAAPGSSSADALNLLASWAVTLNEPSRPLRLNEPDRTAQIRLSGRVGEAGRDTHPEPEGLKA